MQTSGGGTPQDLPVQYPYVAADVIASCRPGDGVWIDVGAGTGGLGLALAAQSGSLVVLLDPDAASLRRAMEAAEEAGLRSRIAPVVGRAEAMPFPDEWADLVASRGSVFFWADPAKGIREAHRVLRPGGQAMIGGGLGAGYPAWARREFIRRRHEDVQSKGPEAVRRFRELRDPETFRGWARAAGLTDFDVVGEGGMSADDPRAGLGVWLRLEKGCGHG